MEMESLRASLRLWEKQADLISAVELKEQLACPMVLHFHFPPIFMAIVSLFRPGHIWHEKVTLQDRGGVTMVLGCLTKDEETGTMPQLDCRTC